MGCSCRQGSRSRPVSRRSRRRVAPIRAPVASSPLCLHLEKLGNSTRLRLDPGGFLFFGAPLTTALPVVQALSGSGCSGPFAKALLSADLKLASVLALPESKEEFYALLGSGDTTLGQLRDVLRSL